MLRWIFIFIILQVYSAEAQVQVAFFEAFDHLGRPYRLTEERGFYHMAIQVEGRWYHSFPKVGVVEIPNLILGPHLRLAMILENKDLNLSRAEVQKHLGLPFDYTYTWERTDSSYCSKFVAQLLDIPPSPMTFKSATWDKAAHVKVGALGISPDEVYEALIWKNFRPLHTLSRRTIPTKRHSCRALL